MAQPSPSAADARMLRSPVAPLILKTALPSMAAMLASSLCSLLDALLLGRGGTQMTAAVALSFPLLTVIQTIGFTFGMGGGSFLSRSLGAGDRESAQRVAGGACRFALLLCALVCAPAFAFVRPLMRLLGADDALLPAAAVYASWLLVSGLPLCMNLVLSSLIRGQGKTLPNLTAFAGGAAIGAALQFLLIVRLRRGVSGSGMAMLARESATLLLLLFALYRDRTLVRPRLFCARAGRRILPDVMQSGLPTLLRQGLTSLSSALLTRACAAAGETALAGMGIAVRAAALISAAVIGFGQGFAPVCGFAFGAGDAGRIRSAYRFCMRCVVSALLIVGALTFAFAPSLLARFSVPPQAAAFGAAALRAQSIVFFAQGAVVVMGMLAQATGQTLLASLAASGRQGYVLIPLVLLLPRLFGAAGLILCQSASDLISLAIAWPVTRIALGRLAIRGSSCARGGCSDARTASR